MRNYFIEKYREFIKNIVYYLCITKVGITLEELTRLSNNILNSSLNVEFSNDEVKEINTSIGNNDYKCLYNLLEEKKQILVDLEKDLLLENIDDLPQFIVDRCNELWKPEVKGRENFLALLSNFERIAVKLSNFNYQVTNGGFSQWYKNGYSSDYDEILEFVNNSAFVYKDKLIEILKNCSHISDSINALDVSDDFYKADYNTRIDMLNKNNKPYDEISVSWNNYVERYLYDNLPDDYLEKIKEYNNRIRI